MARPLFVQDLGTLQSSLRLSGATSTDATRVIADAVNRVRLGFYDELTASRVAAIQAMPASDTPTTADERTRARAALVEVSWVRMHLMRTMPVLFMEGGTAPQQSWNEEPIARQGAPTEIDREIKRLDEEVKAGLAVLSGDETTEDGTTIMLMGPPKDCYRRPDHRIFNNPAVRAIQIGDPV